MPDPISTAALGVVIGGYAALSAFRKNDTSFSPEGRASVTCASDLLIFAENSQALFGAKGRAISELKKMAKSCSKDNWDGDGAKAIDYFALLNAEDFIKALPGDVPMPEFGPEPDGAISLDWIKSRYKIFSISIGPSDRIAYAWLDGTDKGRGVAHFDGASTPSRILTSMNSIIEYGSPALWLA